MASAMASASRRERVMLLASNQTQQGAQQQRKARADRQQQRVWARKSSLRVPAASTRHAGRPPFAALRPGMRARSELRPFVEQLVGALGVTRLFELAHLFTGRQTTLRKSPTLAKSSFPPVSSFGFDEFLQFIGFLDGRCGSGGEIRNQAGIAAFGNGCGAAHPDVVWRNQSEPHVPP